MVSTTLSYEINNKSINWKCSGDESSIFEKKETNDNECLNLLKFYKNALENYKIPPTEIQIKEDNLFNNASFKNVVYIKMPITDEADKFICIIHFVNGILLDPKKLPSPPLNFVGNTLNDRPLTDFMMVKGKNEEIYDELTFLNMDAL